ncbi:MAG: B12-binding domain-containing radical SAM protein [Candidatus Nanoarchaeia archaeon]|nr:B12-binding domain-containing radical SAM protein [Candidatus Nanoarchaeia archaeon]
MNILLVYPKYPDTFWSFSKVLSFVSKKASYPPLGLLTVASFLPKSWNKKVVDCNIENLKDSDIEWADMVFVSAMLVQKEDAQKIISRAKSKNKIVVAGGPAFTTSHEEFKGVDHFVLNEGEITIPLFLEDLKNKKLKKIYTSDLRPDITKTPIPMWDLINIKDYACVQVQYSRGCPFNCEFCDIIIMNGRIPRTKTSAQMIKEFEALYNIGWKGGVFIVDDNFIGNKVNVKEMLSSLIKWQKEHDYPFKFLTEASINLSEDEELMNLMSQANFEKVFLGIETPSLESLKECNKYQNVKKDLLTSVKEIQHHGMQVMAGFIVGFDNDKESIFQRQIDFIQKSGITTAMVGVLNALPQTQLWHRLKKENRILSNSTGENCNDSLNFISKMGNETLIKGYKQILKTIYSPINYYKRINVFLNNYIPTVKVKFSPNSIKPFFKSVWEIGILSNSRTLYWKLLASTFFKNIQKFPLAVEMAIYGLHFEYITKKILANKSI